MKLKALIAILLIATLVVQDTEAWRIRIRFRRVRRIIRRIIQPICKKQCPRVCKVAVDWVAGRPTKQIGGIVCGFGCKLLCGKKKREAIDSGDHVTPLPKNFDFYDLTDDGFIDLNEFAGTMGDNVDDPGLKEAFTGTDVNGDGKLTKEELLAETSLFVFADNEE